MNKADKEARELAFLKRCGLKRYAIHTRQHYGNGFPGPWVQLGTTDSLDEARLLAASQPHASYIDDLATGETVVVEGR